MRSLCGIAPLQCVLGSLAGECVPEPVPVRWPAAHLSYKSSLRFFGIVCFPGSTGSTFGASTESGNGQAILLFHAVDERFEVRQLVLPLGLPWLRRAR